MHTRNIFIARRYAVYATGILSVCLSAVTLNLLTPKVINVINVCYCRKKMRL